MSIYLANSSKITLPTRHRKLRNDFVTIMRKIFDGLEIGDDKSRQKLITIVITCSLQFIREIAIWPVLQRIIRSSVPNSCSYCSIGEAGLDQAFFSGIKFKVKSHIASVIRKSNIT
jgi:hypothetical protein